ncbi:MAG: tetratricopeptide repeat protein, partial [Pirellulales bacterium]
LGAWKCSKFKPYGKYRLNIVYPINAALKNWIATNMSRKKNRTHAKKQEQQLHPAPVKYSQPGAGWLYVLIAVAACAVGAGVVGWQALSSTGGLVDTSNTGGQELSPFELPQQPVEAGIGELRRDAGRVIEDLLASYPDSPRAMHIAATFFKEVGQYGEAMSLWQRCLKIQPDNRESFAGLARCEAALGNDKQALELLNRAAVGQQPKDLLQTHARLLAKTGDIEGSRDVAQRGLKRFPTNVMFWLLLGQAELQLQHLTQARDAFEKSLELSEDLPSAHFGLINTYARLGDKEKADRHREIFDRIHKKPGEHRTFRSTRVAANRVLLADALTGASEVFAPDNAHKAELLLRRALVVNPSHPPVLARLAGWFRQKREFENALVVQRQLAKVVATDAHVFVNLANLATEAGRLDEATEALNTAADLQPQWSIPQRALAGFAMNSGEFGEARAYATRAVEIDPIAQNYWLLATICQELGDAPAARAANETAAELENGAAGVQPVEGN